MSGVSPPVSGSNLRKEIGGETFVVTSVADPDPDPTFHFDADPDPDLSFQVKAKNLEKCSNRLIFYTFWLVNCKIDADLDQAYHFDAELDPDPIF